MKDKEKQIMEMAKEICKIVNKKELKHCEIHCEVDCLGIAKGLFKYYQPRLPEGSVVLSGEQCVEIVQDNYNIGYERGSKETAEKCFKEFKEICDLFFNRKIDCCEFMSRYHNFAKQFDVRIKE